MPETADAPHWCGGLLARIKKPARRVPAGAVRPIAFRQVKELPIRVKPCCRPAIAGPAMGGGATAVRPVPRPDGEAPTPVHPHIPPGPPESSYPVAKPLKGLS